MYKSWFSPALVIKRWPSLPFYGDVLFPSGSLSLFGSRACLLNLHIFLFFFNFTPNSWLLHLILPCLNHITCHFTVPHICLDNVMSLFPQLNSPWHLSIVFECKEISIFPTLPDHNEMLSNNRSNIQSCITTFSKLSTRHWFPPLSKLSITINIYGFLESFQAPLLNGHAKINVNLFFRECFSLFWCNNGIIILQWTRNS